MKAAVAATSYVADEYCLVYSGEASSAARGEIERHSGWTLLDQRGLGRLVDDLPLHKRRDLLDATWGPVVRRLLMESPGADAFMSLDTYLGTRRDPESILNDLGPSVGRAREGEQLTALLHRDGECPLVILVTGPGGRGKTRLVTTALEKVEAGRPTVPVVCLTPGWRLTPEALGELPHQPAIIVVEDAHVAPRAIEPLLTYAKQVDGTQVVLTSRPSAAETLMSAIVTANIGPRQCVSIEVGELSKRESLKLVNSLTADLNLVHGVRSYLANQATHSPHVAVIAANLIRRGDFTASFKLDSNLREQVLGRYGDLISESVDGFDGGQIRNLLATYAAIGPVDASDEDLRRRIADFCGHSVDKLLRALASLHDRGAMAKTGDETRVVPDVLADYVLEQASAVGEYSTGFVAEVWDAFQASHRYALVRSLADLDWRLRHRGGPSSIQLVLDGIGKDFQMASYEELSGILTRIGDLAFTQPGRLVKLLDDLRRRLDTHQAEMSRLGDDVVDPAASQNPMRAALGLPPLAVDDIRYLLPPLYTQCAIADPQLLEDCLDAMWSLHRCDLRDPERHSDQVERQIKDRLANLGALPDETFPLRIVEHVRRWLDDASEDPDLGSTPLFALSPLMLKEGTQYSQQSERELAMRSYLVSADVMRPARDAVRALVVDVAARQSLTRVGAAITLLGEAVRPPQGYFGKSLPSDRVHVWADDDLATIEALTAIAQQTTNCAVRQFVRTKVNWIAYRSVNLEVRHAALTLLAFVDNQMSAADDLAQVLLGRSWGRTPSWRGRTVPTLDELRAIEVEDDREEGTIDPAPTMRPGFRPHPGVEDSESAYAALVNQVATELTAMDSASAIALVGSTVRDLVALMNRSVWRPAVLLLWRRMAELRGDLLADWVRAIATGDPGPLDADLYLFLAPWADRDARAVLDWFTPLAEHRVAIRAAIAVAFASGGWAEKGEDFLAIHSAGSADADREVRDTYLRSSADLLRADPAKTVELLLCQGISPAGAAGVLDAACRYDGVEWGTTLTEQDAGSVLRLVDRAEWGDHSAVEIVAGIARIHPAMVLEHLLQMEPGERPFPPDVDHLAEAFDLQAAVLVDWIGRCTLLQHPDPVASVLAVVLGAGISADEEQHLIQMLDNLDEIRLRRALIMLEHVDIWASKRPALAEAFLSRARDLGIPSLVEDARAALRDAMQLTHWGGVNGVSDDLNAAREAARSAHQLVTDPDLRADFSEAVAVADRQIDASLRNFVGDEG